MHGIFLSQSLRAAVAVFTTSLESQESYLTLRNVTLQTRLSITRDSFRQHSTFARLYNAAASPASCLRSAGSLAINESYSTKFKSCRNETSLERQVLRSFRKIGENLTSPKFSGEEPSRYDQTWKNSIPANSPDFPGVFKFFIKSPGKHLPRLFVKIVSFISLFSRCQKGK